MKVALFLLLTASALHLGQADEAWWAFQSGTAARTSQSSGPTPAKCTIRNRLEPFDSCQLTMLVGHGSTLFLACFPQDGTTNDKGIVAFDVQQNKPLWVNYIYSSGTAVTSNGDLIVASINSYLLLDGKTGALKFNRSIDSFSRAPVLAPNGGPLLATMDNITFALDPTTGLRLWSTELSDVVFPGPCSESTFYVTAYQDGSPGFPIAVDVKSGIVKWTGKPPPKGGLALAMLAGPVLVTLTYDIDYFDLSARDSNPNGTVIGYDAATGLQIWQLPVTSVGFYSFALAHDGTSIVLATGDGLLVVSSNLGTVTHTWPLPSSCASSVGAYGVAVGSDDTAVVICGGGAVAVGIATGKIVWQAQLPGAPSSMAVIGNNTAYFGTTKGFVGIDGASNTPC